MRSPLFLDSIVKSDRSSFEQRIHARSSNIILSISWTQINVFPIEIPQENLFRSCSISIGSRSTIPVRGKRPRIPVSHVSIPPGNPIPVKSDRIVCVATIHIRGERTPDSSSPCLKPPGNAFLVKSRCIGCLATIRIRVHRIELPLTPSKLITNSVLPGNVLLTRWQTNKQTDKLI